MKKDPAGKDRDVIGGMEVPLLSDKAGVVCGCFSAPLTPPYTHTKAPLPAVDVTTAQGPHPHAEPSGRWGPPADGSNFNHVVQPVCLQEASPPSPFPLPGSLGVGKE